MACTVAVTGTGTTDCTPWNGDQEAACNAQSCCGPHYGCTGIPSGHEAICPTHLTFDECNNDGCCGWWPTHTPKCEQDADCSIAIVISHRGECVHCGCTPLICPTRNCGVLADNSPDVCPGCNTCPGNWIIVNYRGDMPWNITVTGAVKVQMGSDAIALNIVSARVLGAGDFEEVGQITVTSGSMQFI